MLLYLLGGYTFQASSISQIYNAINTPTTHYFGSDGRWLDNNPDSWTRANYPTSLTSKSIFDPCPYGYRVPTSNANSSGNSDFFGFPKPTSSTWPGSIINMGMQFLGFWWPTSGGRVSNSAALGDIRYGGGYWSASSYSSSGPDSANYLYFNLGFVNPVHYAYRSYGVSVRCVQE